MDQHLVYSHALHLLERPDSGQIYNAYEGINNQFFPILLWSIVLF